MLNIDFSLQAIKFLKKISGKPAKQIKTKITEMRENPYPQDSAKLSGYPYHRGDSGEYRIIYVVNGNTLEIKICGKRNDDEVYKKLRRPLIEDNYKENLEVMEGIAPPYTLLQSAA